MWRANLPSISASCYNLSPRVPANSANESQSVHDAIVATAPAGGLDPRFLLAIIMQESGGCVRVHTTVSPDGSVRNPGIMQDHDGKGSCDPGPYSNTSQPCPPSQIAQMVRDGALGMEDGGTAKGDGLKQTFAQANASDAQKYYQAARIYNSGTIEFQDLGNGKGATNCYASDVANRLIGFVGTSACTLKRN